MKIALFVNFTKITTTSYSKPVIQKRVDHLLDKYIEYVRFATYEIHTYAIFNKKKKEKRKKGKKEDMDRKAVFRGRFSFKIFASIVLLLLLLGWLSFLPLVDPFSPYITVS